MPNDIAAQAGGVFLLGVHNLRDEYGDWKPSMYCCTSVEYTMGMNELPVLNLIIGQGVPISGSKATQRDNDGSLEELLEQSMSRRTSESKLLRCTLYEADTSGISKYAVFRGYIVGVTELNKTGNITVHSLRVLCLGLGALLHTAPLAGYRRTLGAVIVNTAVSGGAELPTNGALNAGFSDPFVAMDSETVDAICARYGGQLAGRDIITRIALLANLIVEKNNKEDETGSRDIEVLTDELLRIKSCLFCNYSLNADMFPSIQEAEAHNATVNDPKDISIARVDESLNKFLCSNLLEQLSGTSVLASIVTILTSNDMLLNLVPRFKYGGQADDFRMEVVPAESFGSRDIIQIPNTCVAGCNTTLNHIEHLNDPEVLVVDYSDSVGSPDGSRTSGEATGCFGVFSLDPVMDAWARQRYGEDSNTEQVENIVRASYYKTKFFRAPVWLDFAHLVAPAGAAHFKTGDADPQNDNEGQGGDATFHERDLARQGAIANNIAQALYVYLHGMSDVATFTLTPDVRFGLNESVGCLENHIGKTIDIYGYRGVLRQISYKYSGGAPTSSSYSIVLERVRLTDPDEPVVPCALYTPMASNDDDYTGNNELWQDDWQGTSGSITEGINNVSDAIRKVLGAKSVFRGTNVAQQIFESVRAN